MTEAEPGSRRGLPLWPLLATIAMQTLATMAAYSLPAAAPEIAADLGVEGTMVGVFISTVYGVGIVSAVLSPRFIRRFGAARVGQFVMLVTLGMLAAVASGSLWAVGLGAVILGCGYGATAPVATHLLVPRTPVGVLNLVLSIRQIGVPLGGVLAGMVVPPLTLAFGWQAALMVQLVPAALLAAALQVPRRRWDGDRDPAAALVSAGLLDPLRLLATSPSVRNLSATCLVYAGIQLCFIAFMVVHLTGVGAAGLILAGQALATYQLSGVISRPIWGWIADTWLPARWLLVLQGGIIALSALAAATFDADWSFPAILLVCVIAGATASGFTGIAYGEFARLGGPQRTEATAIGSGAMFAGVMLLPSAFGLAVAFADYGLAYRSVAVVALAAALLLALSPSRPLVAERVS